MRLAPILLFAATPAAAHPGAHLHPHAVDVWVVAAALLFCVAAWSGAILLARRVRK